MSKKVITLEKLNRFWTKVKTYLGQYILKTDIVNTFTSTDSSKVAAATTVKTLKDEINQLNTKIATAPGFGKVYASVVTLTAEAGDNGWALVGAHDGAPYYPVAVIPLTPMYATSPICLTSAYHVKITKWDGVAVALPTTIDAFVLWAQAENLAKSI